MLKVTALFGISFPSAAYLSDPETFVVRDWKACVLLRLYFTA